MPEGQHLLIASSAEPKADIPIAQMPAPGAPSALTVVAQMPNETRDDQARIRDTTPRPFDVDILLTKQITLANAINGAFTKADGSSHIVLAAGTSELKLQVAAGDLKVELNDQNEMALIHMRVTARTATDALNLVMDAAAVFLDHLSFMARAPVLTGQVRVQDVNQLVTTLHIVGPEQSVTLSPGGQTLSLELSPIYALYRESRGSSSPYYRLLCLFKIMEGILGVLRKRARERAKALGVTLKRQKERVPDHPDIAEGLRAMIGRPVRDFYDNVLTKRYRDTVAHFLVREDVVLQVSSSEERNRFAEMAFLCDLCAAMLIANHEVTLRELDAAMPRNSV